MIEAARRQKILRKREEDLCRLLLQSGSVEKITKAAERIREATLLLFKGQMEIAKYRETDNHKLQENLRQHLKGLDERIARWRCMGIEEIVALYERRVSGHPSHTSSL